MMINCLLVDDEPVAREGLKGYIEQIDYLNLVGVCKNAVEVPPLIKEHQIDLIYLDIEMPTLTGIDLVKSLINPPLIIFTSAYPQYALESFNLDVLDYLLKPVSFPRFLKATEKARLALQSKPSNHPVGREYFFVKTNNKIVRVSFQDVLFIESLANYVVIHTIDQKIVAYLTTAGIESQLPPELFVRIHKSFIVAYHAILSIKNDEVITEKQALPIGKNQYSVLMEKIKSRLYKR